MFLQFPLFGLILHCCICVCFVIYKIYMLVFDYTSCRMDKLLCYFAAEITIIYTVRAAVLMHNFNDFVTLFGTLKLGWLCHVSV